MDTNREITRLQQDIAGRPVRHVADPVAWAAATSRGWVISEDRAQLRHWTENRAEIGIGAIAKKHADGTWHLTSFMSGFSPCSTKWLGTVLD